MSSQIQDSIFRVNIQGELVVARGNKRGPTKFKSYDTRNPNGLETGYMRITKSLHYSDAIKDLSNLEYRIFMDMKHIAMGHDEVAYTQRKAMENTGCCKATYTTSIRKLVKVGLIEKLPRSAYGASVFRFSARWHEYVSPRRDALTGEIIKKKSRTEFQPNQ